MLHIDRIRGTALAFALALPCLAATAAPADKLADAREQLAAGRADKAQEILLGMLAAKEGDERAVRVLLSDAQVKAGTPQRAVETLEPLTSDKSYEVLVALGHANRSLADQFKQANRKPADIEFANDEARSYLELAAAAAPAGDVTVATELGNFLLYTLGDQEAAMAAADKRLQKDPKDGEALLLRGCAGVYAVVAEQNTGDKEAEAKAAGKAIDDLLAADKLLAKDRYEPWVQLTWLYESQGKATDAVSAALKVLDRYPKADFTTLYHLAKRYAGERRYDAASHALVEMSHRDGKQLGAFISNEPDKAGVATSLGYAIEPLANAQPPRAGEAADILGAIVAVQPNDANLWNNYGLMCRDSGRMEESWRGYSEALKLAPDEPGLHNDAGVILHYYLHRDYDKAQELYERAIELAEAELAKTDLAADRRTEMETVKKDAGNNLAKLARKDYQWKG